MLALACTYILTLQDLALSAVVTCLRLWFPSQHEGVHICAYCIRGDADDWQFYLHCITISHTCTAPAALNTITHTVQYGHLGTEDLHYSGYCMYSKIRDGKIHYGKDLR